MFYHIGIENNLDGRSLAWALDHPGCFIYAETADLALAGIPEAIAEYGDWVASRNEGKSWVDSNDIELVLDGTWDIYRIDAEFELVAEGYEVNAWYRHDWKPLTADEIERGLRILAWTRADLLDAIYGLEPAQLAARYPGERWSIEGILKHVGGAEWWYLDRLGLAFPKVDLSGEAFLRLELSRARLNEVLPNLVKSRQVVGMDGEFWSPRKLLRRLVWHERDHIQHIRRLVMR